MRNSIARARQGEAAELELGFQFERAGNSVLDETAFSADSGQDSELWEHREHMFGNLDEDLAGEVDDIHPTWTA